jgi:hypothetical protein
MGIVLSFAPFIAFALVDRLFGSTAGLLAGALVSAAWVARDLVGKRRSPRLLELGSLLLFGGLAIYAALASPDWSVIGVRLRVDCGLLLIVVASLAVRRPFTLQYAREQVPREDWNTPAFLKTNDVISTVWALAFVVLVAADVVMLYRPDVPLRAGIVATVLALYGAIKFTAWYPNRTSPADA